MKIVILGGGSVGAQIAQQLIDDKLDVTLIEENPETARLLSNRLDCTILNQAGNSVKALRKAGTADADVFVAVTGSDEINMVACALAAAEFNVPRKIARIRNINYSDTSLSARKFLGIDAIVNPEIEASYELIQSIEHGAMSDIILFSGSDIQIRNLSVPRGSEIIGKTIRKAFFESSIRFLIAAILRGDDYIIPDGNTVILESDILYIAGNKEDLDTVMRFFGKIRTRLDKVIIVGGGKSGVLIAENLLQKSEAPSEPSNVFHRIRRSFNKKNVVIVEKNPRKCKQLSQQFPEALVVNADISEEGIFAEENMANADLLLAVTDNQELNIVTALYARSLGIHRAAVLVHSTQYAAICSRLEIDSVTSQKQAVINSVLRNIKMNEAKSIHSLFDGRLVVLEFKVPAKSFITGKPLHAIKFPKDTLVISSSRENSHRIPDGNYVPQEGDTVVMIGKREHADDIQALFSTKE
ncbi:Trk system potassium transporter TrkA [Spirochaeta dissipatitropha]